MRAAGDIANDDGAVEMAKASPRAFTVACEELARMKRDEGKRDDDDRDEDEDEDAETMSKLARDITMRATAEGASSVSAKKLRKAVAAKRAVCSDEVDRASLARNGLSDAHERGAKAHVPGRLGESSLERCRLSQDRKGTPGARENGVVRTLRALEGQ
jgi:hypothetical protein